MKDLSPEKIRNISLVSESGSGKTTLMEAMLFTAGKIKRMGRVEQGNTVSDYTEFEKERSSSITLSLGNLEYEETKINIIDTPGYADFIGQVAAAARVVNAGVIPIDSVAGMGTGTMQNTSFLGDKPLIFVINKLDRDNSDYKKVLSDMKESMEGQVVPLTLPIGEASSFKGVVDIIKMKAYEYQDGKAKEVDLPGDIDVEGARLEIVESAAETDEALMEKYFDAGELTEDELFQGLKKAIASGDIKPVFVCSALNNVGIDMILKAIVELLPSPADFPPEKGYENNNKENEKSFENKIDAPFSALVFNTLNDPHLGSINYLRVFSGKAETGDDLRNTIKDSAERMGTIYSTNGKEREEIPAAVCGDIVATVKLKDTSTGDTLSTKSEQIVYDPAEKLPPAIEVAVESKSKGDADKVARGLARLSEEDTTFFYKVDSELHQTIMYGQGELQLEFVVKTLSERFNVEVDLTKPNIAYRETISGKAEAQGKFKKQTGGHGQFGDVYLRIAPTARGEGFEFVNEIVGGVIPTKFIPSVEKGVVEALAEGPLTGSKVVDVQVTVYYGSYHSVDSSDMAFKQAAKLAFVNVFEKAKPYLLEPIYSLEIMVPEEFTGDVMGDVSSRRGKIQGMEPAGKFQLIKAQIPKAELYKYSTTLRSLTQGTGVYKMEFSHYDKVPHDEANKIIEAAKKEDEE
ncbi:MAG: elongation factor G [Candidatus Zixiibacteriota bacterium]